MLARMKRLVCFALLGVIAAPALGAGASNFTLVNGTGTGLAGLSIRRAGTQEWKTLGAAPSAGARSLISFSDPDCAFDIRAGLNGNRTRRDVRRRNGAEQFTGIQCAGLVEILRAEVGDGNADRDRAANQ